MGILNNDIKVRAGLYMRVSTEDQAREGFSLSEQKERLEAYCRLNNFEIVDYYEDAGISAKKGNYRPEWERLKEDIKSKKINTMIALKQDRITRSIYDWENILSFLVSISNSDHILKNLSNRDPFYLMLDYGDPSVMLITKGYGTEKEEYSAFSGFFKNEDGPSYDYKDVLFNSDLYIFCGEALDYCVYNSVKDFINLANEYDSDIVNKIVVSTRYSSSIKPLAKVLPLYEKLGVKVVCESFEEIIKGI